MLRSKNRSCQQPTRWIERVRAAKEGTVSQPNQHPELEVTMTMLKEVSNIIKEHNRLQPSLFKCRKH